LVVDLLLQRPVLDGVDLVERRADDPDDSTCSVEGGRQRLGIDAPGESGYDDHARASQLARDTPGACAPCGRWTTGADDRKAWLMEGGRFAGAVKTRTGIVSLNVEERRLPFGGKFLCGSGQKLGEWGLVFFHGGGGFGLPAGDFLGCANVMTAGTAAC